jgi:phosphate transport system substrate-binding protein
MKNFIITLLIMIIIIAAGFTAYSYFTESFMFKKNETSSSEKKAEETKYTGERAKANYETEGLRVDSSTATVPLLSALMKSYYNDSSVDYTSTKTDGAYENLIDNNVDVIVVTEPSTDEIARARAKGIELEVTPITNEGFVFLVNKSNPVDNLTLEQVQKIYAGEITNWKEVGGLDEEIQAYQRPENSGSQTGMLSLVMKNKTLMKPVTEDLIETMGELIEGVAAFDGSKSAIGYSYYYYATTMYEEIDKGVQENVKLLSINGIKPNYETIQNQTYPIKTAYYIVTRKGDTSAYTKNLVDFMLSSEGKEIAKEEGYVPVK